ncbi:MAG: hypothetical protein K2Y08_03340, partial [Alphaproteobacteria bacterium]|nr:hypothetical protein [Alphaproteobacteria bacterium]
VDLLCCKCMFTWHLDAVHRSFNMTSEGRSIPLSPRMRGASELLIAQQCNNVLYLKEFLIPAE